MYSAVMTRRFFEPLQSFEMSFDQSIFKYSMQYRYRGLPLHDSNVIYFNLYIYIYYSWHTFNYLDY